MDATKVNTIVKDKVKNKVKDNTTLLIENNNNLIKTLVK